MVADGGAGGRGEGGAAGVEGELGAGCSRGAVAGLWGGGGLRRPVTVGVDPWVGQGRQRGPDD